MKSPLSSLHTRTTKAPDSSNTDSGSRADQDQDQDQDTMFTSELYPPEADSEANKSADVKVSDDKVAEVLRSLESRSPKNKLEDRLAQLDQRVDQFSEQLNKLDANFKLINARLDSLAQRVDSVATVSETELRDVKSQVDTPTTANSDASDIVSTIESRFESLENIIKVQCEKVSGLFTNTTNAGDAKVELNTDPSLATETPSETKTAPTAELEQATSVEKEPTAHWQEQKQAMLAKYGFESETPEPSAAESPEPEAGKAEVEADKAEADTPAADNPPASTEEATVDELKRQLNSKIREAEVEMSINRARLMQERVEFERAQAELERRAATLEAKLAASKGNQEGGDNSSAAEGTNNGLMGRFKRHLGNK